MAVTGAGYIGVELAGMLLALGSQVSVVARNQRVLGGFDDLIGESVATSMRQQDIDPQMGFHVAGLGENERCIAISPKETVSTWRDLTR